MYFPKHGDRFAARAFCRRNSLASNSELTGTKLEEALSAVKNKVSISNCPTHTNRSPKESLSCTVDSQQKSSKLLRRVEVGWLHFSGECYKQVRKSCGGGIRHFNMSRNWTMSEIQDEATKLFFPNGSSAKGALDTLDLKIVDFGQKNLAGQETVGHLYDVTKVNLLRVYLSSKPKPLPGSEACSSTNVGPVCSAATPSPARRASPQPCASSL